MSQLRVDGVDGDLAAVVDASYPRLDRAGRVDRRDLTGPVAAEASDASSLVDVSAGHLAAVVDVEHDGGPSVGDVDRGELAVAAAQKPMRHAGGVEVGADDLAVIAEIAATPAVSFVFA